MGGRMACQESPTATRDTPTATAAATPEEQTIWGDCRFLYELTECKTRVNDNMLLRRGLAIRMCPFSFPAILGNFDGPLQRICSLEFLESLSP